MSTQTQFDGTFQKVKDMYCEGKDNCEAQVSQQAQQAMIEFAPTLQNATLAVALGLNQTLSNDEFKESARTVLNDSKDLLTNLGMSTGAVDHADELLDSDDAKEVT
jgi:hypothetical protein